jgi:predicted MPP superfamily phosphohydrolase
MPSKGNNHLSKLQKPLLFFIAIITLGWLIPSRPVSATADNLVWWPYLQQMTDTSVIILWTTRIGATPVVRYAADTSYSQQATGATRLTPLNTRMHRVELTGLQPNTTYYYKIYVDEADLLPSQTLSFQTAPPPGSDTPFTFVAFGDYGNDTASQRRLRDQMLRDSFRFILTTGDNTYENGAYREFDTNVFRIYPTLFSRAPLFPVLGNHDYHTDLAAPYLDIFDLPQNAWRSQDRERYYSFDYGNVHFVALDTDRPIWVDDAVADDDMFDWLRHDLAHTPRRWKIVAMHVPAYSTGFHRHDSEIISQPKLPPIFEAYGVDLVLSGHDHTYQRSYPLREGQITPIVQGGVVYVVSGAGSAASYPCEEADWLAVAYCSQTYGLYSRVTVNGNTLQIKAVDERGLIKDSFTITKSLDIPLTGLTLAGPSHGDLSTGQTFVASASPITVTMPLTYVWQAEAQSLTRRMSGLGNTATFTWTIPGMYQVDVTATDAQSNTAFGHHTIVITNTTSYPDRPN